MDREYASAARIRAAKTLRMQDSRQCSKAIKPQWMRTNAKSPACFDFHCACIGAKTHATRAMLVQIMDRHFPCGVCDGVAGRRA
jgi:hypothetical protein